MHYRKMHSHYSYEIYPRVCATEHSADIRRTSTTIHKDIIIVNNTASQMEPAVEVRNKLVLDVITLKNPKISWFNSYLSCTKSTSVLKNDIISGTALVVSDGPYYPKEEVGACAWKISTPDGKERVQGGRGVIPGLKKEQNIYRAELGGQPGIALFNKAVKVPLGQYKMKTICDGLADLEKWD